MGKEYIEDGEHLNFVVNSVVLRYDSSVDMLNFKLNYDQMSYIDSIYPRLNFRINDYDGIYILYKVLIDFIENYSVGDIFSATVLVDGVVDFMSNV